VALRPFCGQFALDCRGVKSHADKLLGDKRAYPRALRKLPPSRRVACAVGRIRGAAQITRSDQRLTEARIKFGHRGPPFLSHSNALDADIRTQM
jgi:hypothetical protein